MGRLTKLLDSKIGQYLVTGSAVCQGLILQEAWKSPLEPWHIWVMVCATGGAIPAIRGLRNEIPTLRDGPPAERVPVWLERLSFGLKIAAASHLLLAAMAIGHVGRVAYPGLFLLGMSPGIAAAILSLVERSPGSGSEYEVTSSSDAGRNEPIE